MGTPRAMQHWNLREITTPGGSRSPVVLASEDAARAVLIGLEPGQELGDHEVKELAFLLVVHGSVSVEAAGVELEAEQGTLLRFDPEERRAVSSVGGARLLLFLAPWPGLGHYRGGDERAATAR